MLTQPSPFMLHSASRNLRRDVRIITNPPVSLKEPFNYDGKNPNLVEQKTLRDLGHPEGINWKITSPRERIIPDRVAVSHSWTSSLYLYTDLV